MLGRDVLGDPGCHLPVKSRDSRIGWAFGAQLMSGVAGRTAPWGNTPRGPEGGRPRADGNGAGVTVGLGNLSRSKSGEVEAPGGDWGGAGSAVDNPDYDVQQNGASTAGYCCDDAAVVTGLGGVHPGRLHGIDVGRVPVKVVQSRWHAACCQGDA